MSQQLKRDYHELITKLLPPGPAWHRLEGSVLDGILRSGENALQQVDAIAESLLDEADPRTAQQTFDDWLRTYGLPDDCLKYIEGLTEQQLRRALLVKVKRSGLTLDFFCSLGAIFDIDIHAGYCTPFRVDQRVDNPLYGTDWGHAFVLLITADVQTQKDLFRVNYRADQRLATWGIDFLECLIKANAPAHAQVIFRYE